MNRVKRRKRATSLERRTRDAKRHLQAAKAFGPSREGAVRLVAAMELMLRPGDLVTIADSVRSSAAV